MKTVLTPNAPWPKEEPKPKRKRVYKPRPPKPKKPKKPKQPTVTKHEKLLRGEVDFFKEAREQLATGTARGPMRKKKET